MISNLRIFILLLSLELVLLVVVDGVYFNFDNKTNDDAKSNGEKAVRVVANKRYLDNIWWRPQQHQKTLVDEEEEKENHFVDPFFKDFSRKFLKMLNSTTNSGDKQQQPQQNQVHSLESLLNKWIDQENKANRKSNKAEQQQQQQQHPMNNLPYAIRGG